MAIFIKDFAKLGEELQEVEMEQPRGPRRGGTPFVRGSGPLVG